ncbi:MAG TPA: isoprenylcysteine carboxylmethyltransferase family protein [Nitrososphaerales archaeon]|nr:isoprenylcysteine carboxylmethyltransferase family protein [Nitrososphaerales archaeon]
MEKRSSPVEATKGEPVWYLLAILLVGVAGNYLLRWGLPDWPAPFYLGIAFVLTGTVLIAWAGSEFSSHRTTLLPSEAATTVVKSGPYGDTRNPIYLSMALAYFGIALMFDSPLALLLLVPVILVLNRQAVREEHYLEGVFGDQFTEYNKRVRRWL